MGTYDDLLEKAMKIADRFHGNGLRQPIILTGDSKVMALLTTDDALSSYKDTKRPLIYKIHGCADRETEHLVFTRSDYRRHYRTNDKFFDELRELLGSRHTLFLGFSHTDPEVSRLLETVIHRYEERLAEASAASLAEVLETSPYLCTMDFRSDDPSNQMLAARGINSATLRDVKVGVKKDRYTIRTGAALGELFCQKAGASGARPTLEKLVRQRTLSLAEELTGGLEKLQAVTDKTLEVLLEMKKKESLEKTSAMPGGEDAADEVCSKLLDLLSPNGLATQGVWLVNENGKIVGKKVAAGQNRELRSAFLEKITEPVEGVIREFARRPYFRLAQSFGENFASDVDRSILNHLSTVFLCQPVLDELQQFQGLLFSATQPGEWKRPKTLAKNLQGRGRKLVLIDGNGVPLVPVKNATLKYGRKIEKLIRGGKLPSPEDAPRERNYLADEPSECNRGFSFADVEFDARDELVQRVNNLIVPLVQENTRTIYNGKEYDVVTMNVPRTSWKLAIAEPVHGQTKADA